MSASDAAVALYHQRLAAYRERTSAGLTAAWDELDTYGDEDLETYVARVTPLLEGAKAATVATSAAFFALALGIPPASVSARVVEVEPRTSHPFLATWHALKEGRALEEAVAAGRSQAQAVGFDFVQSTSRRTGDYVARASGQLTRWRRRPGAKACSWCRTVAGQLYQTSESADFGHDRCVLGDTLTWAPSPREAVRRRYVGEVVIIHSASGNQLSVTPNHPVLTDRGWVAAGALSEGVNLVRSGSAHGPQFGVPHKNDMPSRIEQRFRAGAVSALVSVPFASENFHGDWGQGQVDVVPALGLLKDDLLSHLTEPSLNLDLSGRACEHPSRLPRLCRAHQSLFGLWNPPHRRVGGSRLRSALIGAHTSSAGLSGLAAPSWRDAVGDEVAPNGSPPNPYRFGEAQFRFPGQVTLDHVSELRRVNGSHWVYNLRTLDGWYSANGIVVHNCDCVAVPASQ